VSALGEEFKSAREARGLSLSDVAERLHIRSVYLAAIEDEDWHVIGAPVYVRGFMRTYARFLGLDPEGAVARFSAAVPPGTLAASAPSRLAVAAPAERAPGETASPSLAAILAIALAVVAVIFVAYEFYQYRAGAPAGLPAAQSTAAPDAGDVSPVADASAPAPDDSVAAGSLKPGLGVQVTDTSWLRVSIDGKLAYEGTLRTGAVKSFAGKVADVRVGNAGGVRVTVNGRALGPLGHSGDVVERRFILTGE
jgi:cytoskeletal protein RodZ